MAQAAQRQHPARGAFPGQAQPIPGDQKESEPIKIDPIAKKINDIIYADDKPETDGKFKYFVELTYNDVIELGVPRGLINQANNCWVNSLLQTALVCEPLYKLLKKLLFYTQSSEPGKANDKELANIGNEIKRMLPTCAKLAEVFGEMFTKVRFFVCLLDSRSKNLHRLELGCCDFSKISLFLVQPLMEQTCIDMKNRLKAVNSLYMFH